MTLPARAHEVSLHAPSAKADALVHRELLVHVNGTALFVEERGRPGTEPVLFSHGLLMDGRMFAAQCESLSGSRYCITVDHRGQGRSEEQHEGREISIEQLVDDHVALLERLDLGPVHFCGHSMGGFVGMHLAVRRPDLLRSLVLMDTTCRAETPVKRLRFHVFRVLGRWFGHGSIVGRVLPYLLGRTILADPSRRDVVQAVRSTITGNRRSVWRAINGVLDRAPLDELLPRIEVPTLVMVGAEDRATIPEKSHELQQAIPGARLVEIPRAGHSPTIEEPEAVSLELARWLSERRGPAADSPGRPGA